MTKKLTWSGARALLLDSGNKMYTLVESGADLQQKLDDLIKLLHANNKELCVGDVHLVTFGEVPVRLHLRKKKCKRGPRFDWDIRFE